MPLALRLVSINTYVIPVAFLRGIFSLEFNILVMEERPSKVYLSSSIGSCHFRDKQSSLLYWSAVNTK